MLIETKNSREVLDPKSVYKILTEVLNAEDKLDRDKEHFWVFGLTSRNTIKYLELVSMGTLNSNLVHPREVYRRAVMESVARVIVAHNHPSGEVEPSEADLLLTPRLVKAGEILGIDLIDHVIIDNEKFLSFKEQGLLTKAVK